MRPLSSFDNVRDLRNGHTKLFGQHEQCNDSTFVRATDFNYIFFTKLCRIVMFSAWSFLARREAMCGSMRLASFFISVASIIKSGAKKKMIRIHTRWIIAMMANMKFGVKSSKEKFITEAMRTTTNVIKAKSAISVHFSAMPIPASIDIFGNGNITPESCNLNGRHGNN